MTTRTKHLLWLMSQKPKLRTFSGVPPLTFKAKKSGTLKNYRIYGNTVNGDSVGDRTANLFDYSTVTNGYRITWTTGVLSPDNTAIISDYIPINTGRYRSNINIVVACYDDQKKYIGVYSQNGYRKDYVPPVNDIALDNTCAYIRIFTYEQIYIQTPLSQSTMFNSGPTPLPYESYGYRVPVTVANGTDTETTNIYLDEQLTKSGDNADYIDYNAQKRYNVDGTFADVTLPALPTLSGINTLSVATSVQPSNIEITGKIKGVTA